MLFDSDMKKWLSRVNGIISEMSKTANNAQKFERYLAIKISDDFQRV